jgi:spore germination protein YaaH
VWFENSYSIEHKLNIALAYGVAGVHFWHLGGEDPRVGISSRQFCWQSAALNASIALLTPMRSAQGC